MNAAEAEKKIHELLVSKNSLPARVRSKSLWNKGEFNELLAAIDFLIKEWADKDTVPKCIALAFVDIYGSFSFKDDFYSEDEQEFLEDMGILLQEKATDLFA